MEGFTQRRATHGKTGTLTYRSWLGLRRRCIKSCTNPKRTMCDRWWESFKNFYADMGERPTKDHSIDRIDNGKGYEPGNCRWATREQQSYNKTNNRIVEFKGEKMPQTLACKTANVSLSAVRHRIERHNENFEVALSKIDVQKHPYIPQTRWKYHSEIGIYCGMIDRCCNPDSAIFHRYGGRGISVVIDTDYISFLLLGADNSLF